MVGGCRNCDVNQNPCQNRKGPDTCLPKLKDDLCNRIKPAQVSAIVLENVLDIASTLVHILQICGIHECKANRALDVIIYAFMHFDEVAEHPGGKCKKRIRKEEFHNDLTRDCGMTKADTKLSYSIVKCAFKAFYHKQVLKNYNMALVDECIWRSAANKTVSIFAHSGASKSQIEITGRRILSVFENFICRLEARSSRTEEPANPCVCSSTRQSMPQRRPCAHASDPCKSEYLQPCQPPDPPLCAQLQCQFVCPPGSTCPQIICKDPCGRLFLKVDGDLICFDPLILECEARRAAMEVCPPSNAERIKALRECLKPCMPKDTDSCDEKLAEIFGDETEGDYQETKSHDSNATGSGNEGDLEAEGEDSFSKQGYKDDEMTKTKAEDEDADEDGDGDEDEDVEVGTGFFISAELKTLEDGKRKLDVKIKGKCRKSEKYINILKKLHVEGNRNEEMWYELTPTGSSAVEQGEISKASSQASQSKQLPAVSDSKSNAGEAVIKSEVELAAPQSEIAGEDKSEPANKDEVNEINEDPGAQNEQASGEPATTSDGDKKPEIAEPASENAGEQPSEGPAEAATQNAEEPTEEGPGE